MRFRYVSLWRPAKAEVYVHARSIARDLAANTLLHTHTIKYTLACHQNTMKVTKSIKYCQLFCWNISNRIILYHENSMILNGESQ